MQSIGKAINEVRAEECSKRELILNWFRAGGTLPSGSVEGFSNKVKLVTRKSYGFKTQEAYEIALYHNLGDLPQLEFTHRFFSRSTKIRVGRA